jgi:hypothetical protein
MPVERTQDNPHGWGYIDTRAELTHYQLSPRIQIVTGDVVKVSKGPYYSKEDGTKLAISKHRGEWVVTGIFENRDGDIELDVSQYGAVMVTESTTLRVTGEDFPSSVMKQIIRRPYKIKLAKPRTRRRRKASIENTHVEPVSKQEAVEKKPAAKKTSLSDLARIIEESKNG